MFGGNRPGGSFGLGNPQQGTTTGFGGTPSFGQGGTLGGGTGMPAFGQPQATAFGQTPLGGPSPGGFGTTTPGVFGGGGGGATTPFGQTTGGFGQQQAGGLGAARPVTGFGSTPGATGFGLGGASTGTGGLGINTGTGFGATPSTATAFGSTGGFGQQQTQGLGGTAPGAGGGLFGTPSTGGAAFGVQRSASTAGTGGFGGFGGLGQAGQTSTTTTGFGATPGFGQQQQPTSAFGQTTSATTFGAPAPFGSTPNQASGFGGGASAWGAGGIGTRAAQPGTGNPPYKPTQQSDTNGASGLIEAITAMDAYKEKSFEELRWEDYQRGNNKGGPSTALQTGLGMTGGFGGLGGQQQTTPGLGGGFGASTQAWGQPNKFNLGGATTGTLGGGGFGTGGFGSTAVKPAAVGGGFGTGATGFGQTPGGTSLFGAQATQQQGATSGFGTLGQQAPGLGGGLSTFGAPGAGGLGGTTPSLFGAAPAPAPGGFGLGGATTGGFGTTASPLGGVGTTTGGLGGFGTPSQIKPATGFGGGFGTGAVATGGFGSPSTGLGGAKPGGFGTTTGFGTTAGTGTTWGTPASTLGGGFGTPQTSSFSGFKPATTTPTLGGATSFGGFGTGGGLGQPSTTGFGGGGLQQTGTPGGGFGAPPLMQSASFPGMPTTTMQGTLLQQQQQQMTPPTTGFLSTSAPQGGTFGTPGDQANLLLLSSSGKKGITRSRSDSTAEAATPPALQSYRHTPRSAAKLYPRGMQRALEASGGSSSADVNIVSPISDSFTSRSIKTLHLDDINGDFLPAPTSFAASSTTESKSEPLSNSRRRLSTGDSSILAGSPRDSDGGRYLRQMSIDAGPTSGDGGASESKGGPPTPDRPSSSSKPGRVRRPQLTKAGYTTEPSMEQLASMPEEELRRVRDFTVQNVYGSVRWEGVTDVTGLNLDQVVDIRKKEVVVYPEDDASREVFKPPVGKGLNKPALITLFKVVTTKKKPEQYREELRALVESWDGATFVNYDVQTGMWSFRVQHFSRYGAPDDEDEDEEGGQQTKTQQQRPAGGAGKPTPRPLPLTRASSSTASKRRGYGLQDSDDDDDERRATPMDEGTGEGAMMARGTTAPAVDKQAKLDEEFEALARQNEEEEEAEGQDAALLAVESTDSSTAGGGSLIPLDIKNLSGLWAPLPAAEERLDAAAALDESVVPWSGGGGQSVAGRRRMRMKMRSEHMIEAARRREEENIMCDSMPLGPPAADPVTPSKQPPAPRSVFTLLQPAVVEREVLRSSAKKKKAQQITADLDGGALATSAGFVGDFPLPRAVPPYLRDAMRQRQDDLVAARRDNTGGVNTTMPHRPLDYSRFMGRSFRVGWSADGRLVLPMGNNFVIRNLAPSITHDAGTDYFETPLHVHRASSRPLDQQHQHDEHEDCVPCWALPSAITPITQGPSPDGYHALISCIWKLIDTSKQPAVVLTDGKGITRGQALHQIWELVNALWGQEGTIEERRPLPLHGTLAPLGRRLHEKWREARGGRGEPPNWTDMERRKQAVSMWLKSAIAALPFVPSNISDQEVVVLELLYRYRVDEAAEAAMTLGLPRLATLIPLAGQDPAREWIHEQLVAWDTDGSLDFMDEKVRLVYNLLSGVDEGALHEHLTTWYQSLGLYLWYLRASVQEAETSRAAKNDSLHLGIKEFEQMKRSKPVPWYVEGRSESGLLLPPELLEGKVSTVFSLLLLYTDDKLSPQKLLEPLGLTSDQLDYLMPWLLMTTLHALGLGEAWNPESANSPLRVWPEVTSSLVFQLTSHGLWTWAVYVALHSHGDAVKRTVVVRDLIDRFAWRATETEWLFLLELGIPKEWLYASKAIYLRSTGRYYQGPAPLQLEQRVAPLGLEDAMTYCRKSEDWDLLHDLAMNVAAPRLILEDKELLLKQLLEELERHKDHVRGWERQGSLCLDYLKTLWDLLVPLIDQAQRGTTQNQADLEEEVKLCAGRLMSVYKRLEAEPWCLGWRSDALDIREGGAPLRKQPALHRRAATSALGEEDVSMMEEDRHLSVGTEAQPAIMHAVRSSVMANVVQRLHSVYRSSAGSQLLPEDLETINDTVFHDYRLQQLDFAVDAHIRVLDE